MADFKHYPINNIVVRKNSSGKVQIVRLHPECHPNEESLSPECLNDIVDSVIIKQISPFFQKTHNHPFRPDYHCGYHNLPNELFDQLIQQLDRFENKCGKPHAT